MNSPQHPTAPVSGAPSFAKLPKTAKIAQLAQECQIDPAILARFWRPAAEQAIFDQFAENTLSNFILPYSVIPHLIVNGQSYWVPVATEESSVVAAASKSAKFWGKFGGIHTSVGPQIKTGQVHFWWKSSPARLAEIFAQKRKQLLSSLAPLASAMAARGGGIVDLQLVDHLAHALDAVTGKPPGAYYYQLSLHVKTCDAMGANFINTLLEALAQQWQAILATDGEIIMAILSNYPPECWVEAGATCPVEALATPVQSGAAVAAKLVAATQIAQVDPYRAVTHNKGIMNGIDALLIATGNDFRAVEGAAHAYAARQGSYQGLSRAQVVQGNFELRLKLPLALGVVGGVTRLHPLAKLSLEILQNPSAAQLMQIAAALGLCQNFAALRALVTTGIQQGHMKLHLTNLLAAAEATVPERAAAEKYFADHPVSGAAVQSFLARMRQAR